MTGFASGRAGLVRERSPPERLAQQCGRIDRLAILFALKLLCAIIVWQGGQFAWRSFGDRAAFLSVLRRPSATIGARRVRTLPWRRPVTRPSARRRRRHAPALLPLAARNQRNLAACESRWYGFSSESSSSLLCCTVLFWLSIFCPRVAGIQSGWCVVSAVQIVLPRSRCVR